jgi:hypothetical protein
MGTWEGSPSSRLSELFDASPDVHSHTSLAAELGLLLGLGALVTAPFSVMLAVSLGLAVLGFVFAMVGIVTTSRRDVTGGVLAPLGLLCSFITAALLGLRYLGLDTAFGDRFIPDLQAALEFLNSRLPSP